MAEILQHIDPSSKYLFTWVVNTQQYFSHDGIEKIKNTP